MRKAIMTTNIFLFVIVCSIGVCLNYNFTHEKTYTQGKILPPPSSSQTDELPIAISAEKDSEEIFKPYSKNKVGWLEVEWLKIKEPVMQADDNSYYLTHNAYDRYSVYGACFALADNKLTNLQELSRVTVLFGHNAGNTEATGFSRLKKLKDAEFAAKHRQILLQLTDGQVTEWEVFAAGEYPVEHNYLVSEPSDEYFLCETAEMQKYSYNSYTDIEIDLNDKVLILSTCTGEEDKRFIVVARLVTEIPNLQTEALTPASKADSSEVNIPLSPVTEVYGETVPAEYGTEYARITCENAGINAPVIWGDDEEILGRKGIVAQYTGSNQIGYGSAHLLCSHNYGEFSRLTNVSVGDKFVITTSYGKFVYKVTLCRAGTVTEGSGNIVDKDGIFLLDLNCADDMLYMYTCYPFGHYSETNQRYIVQAILT